MLFNPRLARTYEIRDDIPVMLVEEATTVDDDEATRLEGIVEAEGIAPTFDRDPTISRSCRSQRRCDHDEPVGLRAARRQRSTSDRVLITTALRLALISPTCSDGAPVDPGRDRARDRPGGADRIAARRRSVPAASFPVTPTRIYDARGDRCRRRRVDIDVVVVAGCPSRQTCSRVADERDDRQRRRPLQSRRSARPPTAPGSPAPTLGRSTSSPATVCPTRRSSAPGRR